MRLAGSTLLYSRLSLADACERLAHIGLDAVDLACHEGWAHVAPSTVAADPDGAFETVHEACERAGVTPVALNAGCGNVPLSVEVERVAGLAAFADELNVPVLTLPAAPEDTELADDVERFRAFVDVSANCDVTLTVETHWGTLTADPVIASEYAASIPGLGYTLDPGHYAANDAVSAHAWDRLLPDVRHVHLRQAGSGWAEIQRPPETGRLDFEDTISMLQEVGYDGAVTVEYIDSLDGIDSMAAERQARRLAKHLRELV